MKNVQAARKKTDNIDRKLFLTVNRQIKAALAAGTYDAQRIGKWYDLSTESVRAIRRAGTWPKFVANKKARRAREVELAKQREAEASARADMQHGAQAELDFVGALRNMPVAAPITITSAPRRSFLSRLLRRNG